MVEFFCDKIASSTTKTLEQQQDCKLAQFSMPAFFPISENVDCTLMEGSKSFHFEVSVFLLNPSRN
jgi:hypothetical protein